MNPPIIIALNFLTIPVVRVGIVYTNRYNDEGLGTVLSTDVYSASPNIINANTIQIILTVSIFSFAFLRLLSVIAIAICGNRAINVRFQTKK